MALRSIPIRLFTTPRRDTTPLGWRFPSALAWQWAHFGAVVGAVAPAGAGTTSPSTTTTISTVTRILAAATACRIYRLVAPAIVAALETGFRLNQQAAVAETTGSTIRNIAAALRIRTVLPLTGSEARPAAIPFRTAKPAPGNRLAVRAAICRAIVLPAATELEVPESVTGPVAAWEAAIGPAGDRTASEVGTFRAAAEEIETRSAAAPGVRGDTTDRARAPAAAAVLRAWALEAEAALVVAVAADAGKRARFEWEFTGAGT